LVFGFGVPKVGTVEAGTGFFARSTFDGNITEDTVAAAPGSYQATATAAQSGPWSMVVAAFKGR
jgi:hypothetical protein